MAIWSRVWITRNNNCKCSTDCYNYRNPNEIPGSTPTAFDDLPTSVSSLSDVVDYYANQIKNQTSLSRYVITNLSDASFVITFKRFKRPDLILTLQFYNKAGRMPVNATFTGGHEATFYSMNSLVVWVVDKIK